MSCGANFIVFLSQVFQGFLLRIDTDPFAYAAFAYASDMAVSRPGRPSCC
jgi:hypothetical protein